MAHDVFISYSSKDKIAADALCATLEAHGILCWIAPRNISYGSDYGEAIVDGINESRMMVLVFSSHANTSPHIKREVDRAVSKSLTIIPIRIEDVAPTRALEYYISPVHWLDAVAPPLEPHLETLAGKIQILLSKAGVERHDAIARHDASVPTPAVRAPARPAAVDPSPAQTAAIPSEALPPPRRFGLGAMIGGAVAVIAVLALLWVQPWTPGDKTKEVMARQAQLDDQRRQEQAARQAQIDDQRRRDTVDADAARRGAEEATKRANEAAARLEAARKAEEVRVAKALEDQRRHVEQIVPKPGPAPAPVARLDPGAAKGVVEEKLRAHGLLKQSGGNQWGVTVDITSGGVVTLTGVLQNNQQRNDTVRLAAEVPGVTEVVQRINVQQSWNTR
jgi:osmotically-inducible protein OsmY